MRIPASALAYALISLQYFYGNLDRAALAQGLDNDHELLRD